MMKRIMAIVFALLGLALALSACSSDAKGKISAAASASDEATDKEADEDTTPTDESCKFPVQEWQDGDDAQAIPGFEALAPITASLAAGQSLTDEARAEFIGVILENSAKYVPVLGYFAFGFGLIEDPNATDGLAADGCLTDEGIKLYHQLEGTLKAAGENYTATTLGKVTNSGIVGGQTVVANGSGVQPQHSKAVTIKLKDGSFVTIMMYCANVVWLSPPSVVPASPAVPKAPKEHTPPATQPPGTHSPPPTTQPPANKQPHQGSGPQGNAPTGQGPNVDRGPGTYVPSPKMEQPPAASYTPPAPPPPAPAPGPGAPTPIPTQPTPTQAPIPVEPDPAPITEDTPPPPGW